MHEGIHMKLSWIIEHILSWSIIIISGIALNNIYGQMDAKTPLGIYTIITFMIMLLIWFTIKEIKLLRLHIQSYQLDKTIKKLSRRHSETDTVEDNKHLDIETTAEDIDKILFLLRKCEKRKTNSK